MTDEYDSWRRYEDDKTFKNKLAEIEHMKSLLVRLFEFLDLTEESDSGNIFHPITIGSCRADKQQPLEDLLAEMKKASM
jgi:hypothetical protein